MQKFKDFVAEKTEPEQTRKKKKMPPAKQFCEKILRDHADLMEKLKDA